MLKLYPQCDGIRRQGLWQVIRVGLDEVMEWGGSQLVLVIKNPSANAGDMRDEGARPGSGISTGGGMTAHSSILPWEISWKRGLGGYSPRGCKELDTTETS